MPLRSSPRSSKTPAANATARLSAKRKPRRGHRNDSMDNFGSVLALMFPSMSLFPGGFQIHVKRLEPGGQKIIHEERNDVSACANGEENGISLCYPVHF